MKRQHFNRRDFLQLSAGVTAGALVAGCSSAPASESQSEAPAAAPISRTIDVPANVMELDNAATGIPYEVKESINGGEPITLEYWEWALDRFEYEQEWAEEYMKLYPNVTINVSNQSWSDYWTKLTVNVPAGQGPALWHMHTSKLTEFCDGQLMDPMPDWVANREFLDEHWVAFPNGAMDCPTGTPGSRHFIPMGTMMPVMYINTQLWEEAGFTEADVPKSWEQLRSVARALTKYDSADRIVQAGYQTAWLEFIISSQYQQGRYLFTADGKKAQIVNQEMLNTLQFIKDLHEVDRVTDPEFPDRLDAFAAGQTAIMSGYSWVTSVLRRNNPDLEWFASIIPTVDGELSPAYGQLRFAVEAVVNAFAPPEEKEVAWDFWHFLYSNDTRVAETVALRNGFIPPYDKLIDLEITQDDEVASVIASAVDWGVVGDTPAVYNTGIGQDLIDPILLAGMDIQQAMESAEGAINDELAQRDDWNIIERNYKHHNLMIPDQP